jgi:hypothetical protein
MMMRDVGNINLMSEFRKYVGKVGYGDPIIIADVVLSLNNEHNVKINRNTVSKYLNRLVLSGEVRKFEDGIFYKSRKNKFGETKMDVQKLIKDFYLIDVGNKEIIGYRIGAMVLNEIGITNNLENRITIVTNNRVKRKFLSNLNQNICFKKPVTQVNKENYLYFQLLDTIGHIDDYHIDQQGVGRKILQYIASKGLEIDRLFAYAKTHYPKKVRINLTNLLAT